MFPQTTLGFIVTPYLLALLFLASGAIKLLDSDMPVAVLRVLGDDTVFKLLLGAVEVLAGVFMLWPRTQFVSSIVLGFLMAGAVVVYVIYGQVRAAFLPCLVLLALAWVVERALARRRSPDEEPLNPEP